MTTIKKRGICVRGVEIMSLNANSVCVIDKGVSSTYQLHEIVAGSSEVFAEDPLYITEMRLTLHTKDRPLPAGVDKKAHRSTLSDAIRVINSINESIKHGKLNHSFDMSAVQVQRHSLKLHPGKLSKGISSCDIPVSFNTVQSCDYIPKKIASILYALHIYTMYKQMKDMAEALIRNHAEYLDGYTLQMHRVFTPLHVKMYVSQEAQQCMANLHPIMGEASEKSGFKYTLDPKYIYEYFGGQCDCRDFMSKEWVRIAKKLARTKT